MQVLFDELKRVYTHFNKQIFTGKLPAVTFSYDQNSRSIFRFSPPALIIIGPQLVEIGSEKELFDKLLHEMIHISNFKQNLEDVGKSNYHNINFLKTALKTGLVVNRQKSSGWSSISSDFADLRDKELKQFPNLEDFERLEKTYETASFNDSCLSDLGTIVQKWQEKNRRRSYFLKYICNCPPPHNSIRSGRRPNGPNALLVKCEICNARFRLDKS